MVVLVWPSLFSLDAGGYTSENVNTHAKIPDINYFLSKQPDRTLGRCSTPDGGGMGAVGPKARREPWPCIAPTRSRPLRQPTPQAGVGCLGDAFSRATSWDEFQRVAVLWPDDGEVSTVQGCDRPDFQPFCHGDDRCIHHAQSEVFVHLDQLN